MMKTRRNGHNDATGRSETVGHFGATEPLPRLDEDPVSSNPSRRAVATNAMIVAVAFIASRILGLIREIVIAAKFGTSPDYDAYVAAFRIPDLLFLVVMSGAFGSAFIPVFGGLLARQREESAWKLASVIVSWTLLALLVLSGLTLITAGWLVDLVIAPGLAAEQAALATNLTRLLLLSPLLLGLGIAFKGMLEAQERFTLPAFAPVFYNLGILSGALFLTGRFGVYGLAIGVIIGAGLHAGLQFVGLSRSGMRLSLTLDRRVEGLAQVVRLMLPRLIGQAGFQVNIIVMTNFASRLGGSGVSALNYAFQLLMLPFGVLALSLSTVIFPIMARQYELGSIRDMRETLGRALSPLIFLTIPAAIIVLTFRTSIVQVLFQVGSFNARSTELVAGALAWFSIGLLGLAVTEALTRAFYAMQDTKTPVIVALSAAAVNIVFSAALFRRMGIDGLAFAISIAATVEMLVLWTILVNRTGSPGRAFWSAQGRTFLATLGFTPFAWWLGNMVAEATDPARGRDFQTYLVFGYGLTTVAFGFGALAYLVASPDLYTVLTRLPRLGPRLAELLRPRYGRRNRAG